MSEGHCHQPDDAPYKDEDWLRREYVSKGRTLADIRDSVGVSSLTTISYWLDKHDIETRDPREVGELMRGEDHPHWKGGIDRSFYRSWEWRQLRNEVLEERGEVCKVCGKTPEELPDDGSPMAGMHVDHIVPMSQGGARMDKSNLRVLCPECNITRQFKGGEGH